MSQQVVEQVIGKLVMDKEFRAQMETNRDAALTGYDLSDEECANFAALDMNEFNAGIAGLDERVSKGGFGSGGGTYLN